MRKAMSTVSMVGCEPATISGTDSTDSIVTKDRTRPTSSVCATCGSTISTSTRRREAPRLRAGLDRGAVEGRHRAREHQRHEGHLLPDEGDDDAAPVEEALRLQRLEQPERDERVVHEPVLGEERAHALRRHDERDEERPAVEPAQDRDEPGRLAERQLAGDGDRDQRRSGSSRRRR